MVATNIIPLKDAEFWQDPYPTLAGIREDFRVGRTDAGQQAILRWDDCVDLITSGNVIAGGLRQLDERGFKAGDPLYEWRRNAIGILDGPEHLRIRSLVNRALTHRTVNHLRAAVRTYANQILDRFDADGRIDVRSNYAEALPRFVRTQFLGLSKEEVATSTKQMKTGPAEGFGPFVTAEIREQSNASIAAMMAYVTELYEDRRARPRDDLLTNLIEAEDEGQRLNHDELITLFTTLFAAFGSSASTIVSGIYELARHRDQADLFRSDPEKWKKGVAEETFRYHPALYSIGRKTARAFDAYGTTFQADELVNIQTGAPNRDPRRWQDPDRFDITRDPSLWSMTFGMGSHFCLGQALARCEVQEALAVFVERCDAIELESRPTWTPFVVRAQLDTLPVRYHPTA